MREINEGLSELLGEVERKLAKNVYNFGRGSQFDKNYFVNINVHMVQSYTVEVL